MAFKSKAQKKRLEELVKKGELKKSVFEKIAKGTKDDIPERISEPKRPRSLAELKAIIAAKEGKK